MGMRILAAVGLVAAPVAALAGCLSFGEAGAACVPASDEMVWVNAPATPETVRAPSRFYDKTIADTAFGAGVRTSGDARFELRAKGRHLVEIFLMVADGGRSSFVLEAGGKVVDDRNRALPGPGRMRPKRGRLLYVLGIVDAPVRLEVRTDAKEYVLSAIRWTPQKEFEEKLVPVWLKRARHLAVNPIWEGQEGGPMARRHYLQQLYDRLYFSEQPGLKREAVIGLARAWYWLAAENHEPFDIARTAQLFEEALKVAPDEPIVHQMISASCTGLTIRVGMMPTGAFCAKVKPVPWAVEVPAAPKDAPEWALAQRRLARRMEAITRWWVEKRQQPNGELGGAWGDDVEILRNWAPQAMGLGSQVAAKGIQRMVEGLWSSGQLLHGYDRNISDVEHSSEPTTDTGPLVAALFPRDPAAVARLRETTACADHWIAKQPDGRYRFRTSWFNCRQHDPSPERAVDVHMNVRAMGPALWYAYLSRGRSVIELLAKWAESWVEAMRRTEHGKPAGIFPSAVKSADGDYLVNSTQWDKPDAEWDYYQWSGESQYTLTLLLLALQDLTGEERWLDAASESFQVLNHCGEHARLCKEIRDNPEAFYEWRRRSGDPRYDKFFGHDPAPPDVAVLKLMAEQARKMEERLAYNFEMFTSEVLYTDRVYYKLPAQYRRSLFGGEAPMGERYPTFAVTWPAVEAEFARAVLAETSTGLRLRAYSFEKKPHTAPVRVWRLASGRYRWETRDASGAVLFSGEQEISALPADIPLSIPGEKEVSIQIRRAGP